MAILRHRRTQLAVASGTEGTEPTWSNVETAANAKLQIYDPKFTPTVNRFERKPLRANYGKQKSVPTTRWGELTFSCELKGSGTAGVAPTIGLLLKACAMTETINTGTASIGTARRVEGTGTGAAPGLSGTFTGTKSGILAIQISAVTTNTSIAVLATFYPGDGTAPSTASFTQSSTSPVALTAVAAGVSFDFGDPSSSTAGYVVGDRFVANLVSDQQVQVAYTNNTPDGTDQYLDVSYIQDGRARRMYSCLGTWEITGTVGEVATIQFTLTGMISDSADVSLLTGITYQDTVAPPFMNLQSIDAFGQEACFTTITITQGGDVQPKQCAGATTGIDTFYIVDRSMSGSFNPTAVAVATWDSLGAMVAGTEDEISFQIGTVAGNIVEIEMPLCQITALSDDEDNDILRDGVTFDVNAPINPLDSDYSEITLIFR